MAGSGKGRGRAAFTFNIEAIGFSKGESLPEVVDKPSPVYPITDFKPVPLKMGEAQDYMLALKQELRGTMKKMPYFMPKKDEAYNQIELQMEVAWSVCHSANVTNLLQELEKKGDEEEKSDEEKEKKKEEEEEEEEEAADPEADDEEEHEEENDYIASYFEDGDDFGAGSDDNMDEATY
uniref:DNA-directed RNA polymerase III subunit n=1 Tax=Sphenodon punctatus TaxID=8508 RepID=A0A8D0GDC4_SPHPU